MPQYADQVFMFFNGVHYEIKSVDWDVSYGKKTAVPTMNLTGRPLGTKQEVGEASFNITVPRRALEPSWTKIEDATITFVQRVGGAPLYTAIGASYAGHTASSNADGEQEAKVEFICLDWLEGV